MARDFDPTGERAKEYAALSSNVVALIAKRLTPTRPSDGNSEARETEDLEKIFGDNNSILAQELIINHMRTNFQVVLRRRDGGNRFELTVNRFTQPAKPRAEGLFFTETETWKEEDETWAIIHQNDPMVEEGVSYVFEKTSQGIKSKKEGYYRKGPILRQYVDNTEASTAEDEILSVAEIYPSLGLSLEELRLVSHISQNPVNLKLLQQVLMPSTNFMPEDVFKVIADRRASQTASSGNDPRAG